MTSPHDRLAQLVSFVTSYYGMTPEQITELMNGNCRARKYTDPKHVIFWMAYQYRQQNPTGMSLVKMASVVAGNHHATVFHAVKKINGRMEVEPQFRQFMWGLAEHVINHDPFWSFLRDGIDPSRSPKHRMPKLTRNGFPMISHIPLSSVKFHEIEAA